MTDETEKTVPPKSEAERRAERLKIALRDNLRRRKAQVRERADPDLRGMSAERNAERQDGLAPDEP